MSIRSKSHIKEYHPQGCSNIYNCKKNAVMCSVNETTLHKLAKFIGAMQVHKYGDVNFDDILIRHINNLANYIDDMLMSGWEINKSDFITEACANSGEARRIDLVNVTTDDRYEFETNPRENKGEGVTTIYIKPKEVKK